MFVGISVAGAQNLSPYLQAAQPTSIWVSWLTTSGIDSTVQYGSSAASLTSTATAPTTDTKTLATNWNWHTVQLTNLAADTFYYYKILTGTQSSPVYRFRTQPALGTKTGHYRVLIAGDNQIQSPTRWRSLLTAARSKLETLYGVPLEESVNLLLNDGDQVDSGTTDQWQKTHFNMVNVVAPNIPVQTTIGNHEGYSDTSYTNYKGLFRYDGLKYGGITSPLTPRYYAYQEANIVFIHMDTEDNSTTQQNWVQSVVTAANADANIDFIVTLEHRPYNVELYVGDTSSWIHNTVMPILGSSPKTVLNFAGHHHMYARGQVKDYPIYHMIAGGSAWDEYWGQSTQQDMDDVQKTICNWTWTILDFDLTNRTMTADTYSEGGPLLGAANGQANTSTNTVGYYTNKKVDSFHRTMGLAAPNTPALTVTNPGNISLPYTFSSTAFSTTTTQTLNTTEFQVSPTSTFTSVTKDVVRDFENYYLDSGSPNYTPIDQNASVNIRNYTIPANGLPNGSYYVRVRHRDSNITWSAWSAAVPFTVGGSVSGTTSLELDKTIYNFPINASNPITATYKFGTGLAKDWVGIYKKGQTPGASGTSSTTWSYVNNTSPNTLVSGTLKLSTSPGTPANKTEYFAAFFTNDGYTEIAPRVNFYVGPTPVLSVPQVAYTSGNPVTISYSNAPGSSTDWIGIYKVGTVPGVVTSTQFKYVTAAAGTLTYTGLADGYYYAQYFVNDGYTTIGNKITFSVGTNISTTTVQSSDLTYGSSFTMSYSNGPGNLKDYIGIFNADAVPGGSDPKDKLVYYIYADQLGAANATVTINAPLPSGNYKAALFINDSYTTASPYVNFTVTDPRTFVVAPTVVTNSLTLTWPGQTGSTYLVQSSSDLKNWTDVTTVAAGGAAGSTLQYQATVDPATLTQTFYRVTRQ